MGMMLTRYHKNAEQKAAEALKNAEKVVVEAVKTVETKVVHKPTAKVTKPV